MAQSSTSTPNGLLPCATRKYKGVRMRPEFGTWVTEIQNPFNKKGCWLGTYPTAEMAARAYDAAVVCLKGPNHPRLNFPDALINPGQVWPCTDHKYIQAMARAAAYTGTPSSPPGAHNTTHNSLMDSEAGLSTETRHKPSSPTAVLKFWEAWIDTEFDDSQCADSNHMTQDADVYMPPELERSLRRGYPIEEDYCSYEPRLLDRVHYSLHAPARDN